MKMNNADKIILIIVTFALLPLHVFQFGFVFSKLWLWFICPLGNVPISIIQSCGIAALVNMPFMVMMYKVNEMHNVDKDLKERIADLLANLLAIWFLFLYAYVLKCIGGF